MNRINILLLLSFLLSLSCWAQDIDSKAHSEFCSDIKDKKAISFYKKGIDKKNYKKNERLDFLYKALTILPDFAESNLAMGLELAARCKLDNLPFTQTLPFFYKAIATCPQIHSDPYYYIGLNYYEIDKNDSAIKYLEKFISFNEENSKAFSSDYNEELYQAKQVLKFSKKKIRLKKNVQFNPKIVSGVSSQYDEYLAIISADDKSCFFVRSLPFKNLNQVFSSDKLKEVFMIAKRDNQGLFNNGEPMALPFNSTNDNQGGCTISIDNKHLYFSMMREEGGLQPNCDIYVSDNFDGEWGEIRKLSRNINDPKYWDSQPTIDSDGITLYFASDRPGGYGGTDLYFSKRDLATGQWSLAENLGPNINTAGDEKTPFMHGDSETLYFSSNGHFGFGNQDIFYVRKNEKGEWGESENIGFPINGETDDAGFFVSADSKNGYFFSFENEKVTGRSIGRYDFYEFELYAEARPQQIFLLKGTIKDSSGNQISGAEIEIKDMKTKKKSFAMVDSTNGEYVMAIKKTNDLLFTVKKNNLVFNSKKLNVSELSKLNYETEKLNFEVKEIKTGNSFIINNIYYNSNSAELTAESRIVLENFSDYLKEHINIRIEIQGHTDNVGNTNDNEALSTNRAFSVKSMLEELGIDGTRINAKGFGSRKPLSNNNNETGRSKNRRTEFLILEM